MKKVLKKIQKKIDRNNQLWYPIKVIAETVTQKKHLENRRLNSM
jgi:hypothetical protein